MRGAETYHASIPRESKGCRDLLDTWRPGRHSTRHIRPGLQVLQILDDAISSLLRRHRRGVGEMSNHVHQHAAYITVHRNVLDEGRQHSAIGLVGLAVGQVDLGAAIKLVRWHVHDRRDGAFTPTELDLYRRVDHQPGEDLLSGLTLRITLGEKRQFVSQVDKVMT